MTFPRRTEMRKLAAFPGLAGLGFLLAACSGGAPPPPINVLGAAEDSISIYDEAILAYEKLPLCPVLAPVCQSADV
jgi:hypothetical protein